MAEYLVELMPLRREDGGGFLACVPDLPGCMSDGETEDEAVRRCRGVGEWIDHALRQGEPIPQPSRRLTAEV